MKKIRLIATIFMIITMAITMSNIVFAGVGDVTITGTEVSGVSNVAAKALGAGQVICYVAAVILIMWMGVKWLTSAPEGKAEMKKGLIQAAIASALLVGAGVIMTAIGNTIQDAVTTATTG